MTSVTHHTMYEPVSNSFCGSRTRVRQSPNWKKTLLIVTFDGHSNAYDLPRGRLVLLLPATRAIHGQAERFSRGSQRSRHSPLLQQCA
jgi:hypothetical protein